MPGSDPQCNTEQELNDIKFILSSNDTDTESLNISRYQYPYAIIINQ